MTAMKWKTDIRDLTPVSPALLTILSAEHDYAQKPSIGAYGV